AGYGPAAVQRRPATGVPADRAGEPFVGRRAWTDNWRSAGVPCRLGTGKRRPSRTTEVLVNFKPVTHWVFDRPNSRGATPNRLRMRLQPEETIELGLMGSLAAPEWGATELMPMSLDMAMLPPKRRIAYERLMIDALKGDQTLFVRDDEVDAAWRWIDSISAAWQQAGTPV